MIGTVWEHAEVQRKLHSPFRKGHKVTVANQQNLSVSNVVASLAQYGSYVQFTDLVEETSIDPYLTEASQVLGEQAGSTIDILVRNTMTTGTNIRFAGGVGSRGAVTASSILNSSEIRKANRTLKRANARGLSELGGKYGWILHPDAMQDLLSDSTITTSFERGAPRDLDEQAEFLGYVGSWGGFTFVETTNARIYASAGASGADVYANLCVARDSYAITELGPEGLQTYYQPRGSSGAISDPLHQVGSIGWKTTFTSAILNQSLKVCGDLAA